GLAPIATRPARVGRHRGRAQPKEVTPELSGGGLGCAGRPRLKGGRAGKAPPCGRDQKNSPSRFRFRPPLPLTFPFRVLPSDSVSTYLRSVLGASSTLTCQASGSRGRKKTWPQFAEISLFNISTAFLTTRG